MNKLIDVNDFKDICPYNDSEVPEAIQRIKKHELYYRVMQWVYPNLDKADFDEMLDGVRTVAEFQENLSGPAFKVITQMTTSGLTFTNMAAIEKDRSYLFLSNHRDIILDSALLNVSLMERGYRTTQIAIGDNLLRNPIITDLVRLNKNFIVNRDIPAKEMLSYSQRLSNYIRHVITEENTSIWIAHREGRSKDGDDRTANGLLKMLSMSGEGSIEDRLRSLNILPMVVSYEYDPCDLYKANELISIKLYGSYKKQQGEDYRSMLKGLTGHKGKVNICVGQVVDKQITYLESIQNKNDKIRQLAIEIDREMHMIYRLWPSNYIAYDLLHGTREFSDQYSNLEKFTFRNYLMGRVLKLTVARKRLGHDREGFRKAVREVLLQMYANPVINRKEAERQIQLLGHSASAQQG